MDDLDMKIVNELKQNSRLSASEISRHINLSVPAVSERIKKLEQSGLIKHYTIQLERAKTKYKLLAFVLVNTELSEDPGDLINAVNKNHIVLECHHVAGEYDYLLKIWAEDTDALENFLSQSLRRVKGIRKANTFIVLSTTKEEINPDDNLF